MPLVLAIEPDRRQASQLAALVRIRIDAELLVADSTRRAVSMLGARLPDLILTSPHLSAGDEAALDARLRQLDAAAAHVQVLTIPALAASARPSSATPARRRRTGGKSPGTDPSIFAAQISDLLERAAAERALHRAAADAGDVASPSDAAIAVEPVDEASAAVVAVVETVEAAGPAEEIAPVEEGAEARRELWSALPADDSRAWAPLEGVRIRIPPLVVPLDHVEAWAALAPSRLTWPPIEGLPAHESAARVQAAATLEQADLMQLVDELRREVRALRMLHAEPPAPAPAASAPGHDDWGVCDPEPYGMPALLVRLDTTPPDLPDDPPTADRPS